MGEILMPQLNCKFREKDVFFAVPTKLFNALLKVGVETGLGQQITDKQQRNEITNKFRTLATQSNDRRELASTSATLITPSCGFSNTGFASVAMIVAGMFLIGFEVSRRSSWEWFELASQLHCFFS